MDKAISLDKPMLRVSVAPHIQQKITTSHLMYNTLIALVPALLAGIYFFGFASLKLALICMATAVACEAGMQSLMGRKLTIQNGSSLVLGLLFALICSPEVPWWTAVVGTAIAVILGREIYGGLGNNPFNAVLVGWAVARISFTDQMTTWIMPEPLFGLEAGGYIEYPPLEVIRVDGVETLVDLPWLDLFIGNVPGTIGTVCVAAAPDHHLAHTGKLPCFCLALRPDLLAYRSGSVCQPYHLSSERLDGVGSLFPGY
jgi:electron transport complex protein RnfD